MDSGAPRRASAPQLTHLSGRRVLVTGATGFIGPRLVTALLDQGALVRVLSRRSESAQRLWPNGEVEVVIGDLARSEGLGAACTGVDTLFHLASHDPDPAAEDPEASSGHWPVTAMGTQALLAEALRARVRCFLFVSSVRAVPSGERALSAYGAAKRQAEQDVLAAGAGSGPIVSVLRLPAVYGSGIRGSLPRMIDAIDRGRFPPLPETGNRRSMVHRDDVVQALLLAAVREEAAGQVYTVTDGETYTTRQIYELVVKTLGRSVPRWGLPLWALRSMALAADRVEKWSRRRLPYNSSVLNRLTESACYDSSALVRDLGFHPTQTLSRALPAIVAEYREARAASAQN